MKNKKFILICILVVLISILIRLPQTKYELGWDTYTIHSFANSINENNYIPWLLNPLSLIGLSEVSYPVGLPLLLSFCSKLSNLDVGTIILIFSFIQSTIALLGVYLLSQTIFNKNIVSIMASLAFSLAPVFVYFTSWSGSSRSLFAILFPYYIWLIFKCNNQDKVKKILYTTTLVIFTLVLFTIHRMYFFLIIILISYLLSKIVIRYSKKLFTKRSIVIAWVVGIVIVFSTYFLYEGLWWQFKQGLLSDSQYNLLPLAVGISYLGRTGLFLILSLYGMFIFYDKVYKKNQKSDYIFLILMFMLISLVFPVAQYTSFILITFSSIFGAYALYNLLIASIYVKNKKIINTLIIISILILVISPLFMLNYWREKYTTRGDGLSLDDKTYYLSNYIKDNLNGSLIFNDKFMSIRTIIKTRLPSIPSNDELYIAEGLINKKNLTKKDYNVLYSLLRYRQLYKAYPSFYYTKIYDYKIDDNFVKEQLQETNTKYFIVNKQCTKSVGYCMIGKGLFQDSVVKLKNKIYDNSNGEIYDLKYE